MAVSEDRLSECPGLAEYTLNPFDLVGKPALPATDSGTVSDVFNGPVCDGYTCWGTYVYIHTLYTKCKEFCSTYDEGQRLQRLPSFFEMLRAAVRCAH